MTSISPRRTAPTKTTLPGEEQPFRVWAHHLVYQEDTRPWKCMAAFYFLMECLEYVAYCQDQGVDVVFQSPAHTNPVLATDRRVVYQPSPYLVTTPREEKREAA